MNKSYIFLFISYAILISLSSFARIPDQPNFELVNTLNRRVYYNLGRADRDWKDSVLYYVLNDNILTLDAGNISKASLPSTIVLNPSQKTELFIYSKPDISDAKVFTFNPGKTIFVNATQDKNGNVTLTPQRGQLFGLIKKNDRGYSLENNVTAQDIRSIFLPTMIPTDLPTLFLLLLNGTPANLILGIEPTADPQQKDKAHRELSLKWDPNAQANYELKTLPHFDDVFKLINKANQAKNLTDRVTIHLG